MVRWTIVHWGVERGQIAWERGLHFKGWDEENGGMDKWEKTQMGRVRLLYKFQICKLFIALLLPIPGQAPIHKRDPGGSYKSDREF